MSRVRVLVVDDSAFARKVVRESLARSNQIEVVDIARDGLEAMEKVASLHPDVITLDLVMPNLDGVGVLNALAAAGPGAPRVVLVSMSDAKSDLALDALSLGALDLVHKPTALATDQLYQMGDELVAKVLVAAGARPRSFAAAAAAQVAAAAAHLTVSAQKAPHKRLVVIGASTGGPQALTRVLSAMPRDLAVPIAVVLHLPVEYTAAFARRLDQISALDVVEARDGLELRSGLVVIARGGIHLLLDRHGSEVVARLDAEPLTSPHRPSVDVLFESAASAVGSSLLAVLLTGMGDDGLAGARAVRGAGGVVLTESESSCVVYGMPRAAREADLSNAEAPIEAMRELILSHL